MTITHHPEPATLRSFAEGRLPEALSAIVSAHIEVCPECSRELAQLQQIAAALSAQKSPKTLFPIVQAFAAYSFWQAQQGLGTLWGVVYRSGLPRLARSSAVVASKEPLPSAVRHSIPVSGNMRVLRMKTVRALPAVDLGGTELTLIIGANRGAPVERKASDTADRSATVTAAAVTAQKIVAVSLPAGEPKGRIRGLLSWLGQPLAGS